MSTPDRRKLLEELKRFSGFLRKTDINGSMKSAYSSLETSDSESSSKDNDFIVAQAVSMIVSSKETQEKASNILHISMNLIITGYFSLKSVIEILKGIENYTVTENTIGLKILQFVSTSLPDYYKSLSATCSLFSIALSLINSQVQIVSNTAFATSQQMISSFFQIIKNYTGKPPKITMAQLDKLVSIEYAQPLFKYPHLLLEDLSRILWQKETIWLHITKIDITRAIDLWSIIITSQQEFIHSEKHIFNIIADSMILPLTSFSYTPIYSTFIINYSSAANILTGKIMDNFLQYCKPNANNAIESLTFFDTIILGHPNLKELLETSDPECNTMKALLDQLGLFIADNQNQTIAFSMTPTKSSNADFIYTTSINIGLVISKIPMKNLLKTSWRKIVNILIYAIRFTSLQSADSVFDCIFNFLKNMDTFDIIEGLGPTVRILCSLASKQRLLREKPDETEVIASNILHTNKSGLSFKRKRILCMQMLKKALTEQPTIFRKKYTRILSTISPAQIDADFSLKLPDTEFEKFCNAATVNIDGYRLDLLGRVLAANPDRSTKSISIIRHSILEAALSKPQETAIFLEHISSKCYKDTSFIIELANTINKTDPAVRIKCLKSLLETVKIMKETSTEDWTILIKMCSENLRTVDIIEAGFDLFTCIVDKQIPSQCLNQCIKTVFDFAQQTFDTKIAISSISLSNKLSKHFNNKEWSEFFNKSLNLMDFEKEEVSKNAIETAVSLVIENIERIDEDVLDLIVNDIKDSLEHFATTTSLWEQHSYILIRFAHFYSTCFNNFRNDFVKELLLALTLLQESCTDGEVNVNLLDFYKTLLTNMSIPIATRREIYHQFISIIEFYIEHETADYFVLEAVGRKIRELLLNEKQFIDEVSADTWLPIIDKLCLSLDSEVKTHPSVKQALKVLPEICVTCGVIFKACYHLTSIITKTVYSNVRTLACQISSVILETRVDDAFVVSFMQSMTPALGFSEAAPIISSLLARQLDLSASESESLFATLKGAVGSPALTQRLVSMFPSISTGAQLSFVQSSADEEAQMLVWKRYCDPGSLKFDGRIAGCCMETVLDNVVKCLREAKSDDMRLVRILQFLEAHGVVPRKVGNHTACRTWHIIALVPDLIGMLNDERKEVADISQKLLFNLHRDFGRIIGEVPE